MDSYLICKPPRRSPFTPSLHPAPLTPSHCACCTGTETHHGRHPCETNPHGAQDASVIEGCRSLAAAHVAAEPQDLCSNHDAQGGRVQSSNEALACISEQ